MIEILMSLAPWLTGVFLAVGGLLLARNSGKKSERQRQQDERMDAIIKGKEIDQEISNMDDDAVREHGRKWVRDSER